MSGRQIRVSSTALALEALRLLDVRLPAFLVGAGPVLHGFWIVENRRGRSSGPDDKRPAVMDGHVAVLLPPRTIADVMSIADPFGEGQTTSTKSP